jgi:hypothetical protein
MNRSKVLSTLIAGSMAALAVTACNAQVLSLGDGGAALPDVAASTTIASLSDAQATDLCNWLIAESPDQNKPPRENPGCGSSIVGYAGGGAFGCGDPMIWWPLLPVGDCIANLRHSPCHSTIASLEQCIARLRQEETGVSSNCSAASACAAYFADPACGETVLSNVQYPVGSNEARDCTGCLPIEAGVTCTAPYSGPSDGGAGPADGD